jgi:hypothetical protein
MREEDRMFRKSKFRRQVLYSFGAWIALAPLLFGQQKEQFAQAQKDNSAALKKYTWKSRTELQLKGESKNVKLEQVRYDLDGKLQKTDIGAPATEQRTEQTSRRGRRGRGRAKEKIIEKKKNEFAELMQALGQLSYPEKEIELIVENYDYERVNP